MKEAFEAVVLANGDYPTAALPLEILEAAPYVACCDGAANAYIAHGRVPDIIIGDGDSLSEENRLRYGHLLHRIAEQESNDLTKTIDHLARQGKRRIAILGATGKSEDHTLGNISLLMDYHRQGLHVRMYTDHGLFIPCSDTATFDGYAGQQVSIFSFGAHDLSATHLRYPLHDFTTWWQGTLNESAAPTFTIRATGFYLVFLKY